MKNVSAVLFILLSLTACKKQPFLDVDKASIDVETAGATEHVTVNANYPWTASSSDSWIKVSYTEGNNVLTITVSRNNDTDSRQGSVTIASEELVKTISINQSQRDAIELESSGRITVDSEAHQIEIKLRSNVSMSARVDEGGDWVSVISTKAMTSRTVALSIKANSDRSMRRALVSFVNDSGSVSQQIMIDQDGKPQVIQVDFKGVTQFVVPLVTPLTGVVMSGNVYWDGENEPVKYKESMSRSYSSDSEGRLRIELQNAESVSFPNVAGLTRVDISGF